MNKTKELTRYEKTSINRIKSLINTHCGGSQRKFAEKTGLNIGSVSQYVNGKNTPSNLNAQKIAKAFEVDPEWVMGFESKKRTIIISKPVNTPKNARFVGIKSHRRAGTYTAVLLSSDELRLLTLYRAGQYKDIVNLMMEKMP